jgi:type I restriction enzyme, S subunit
MNNLNGWSPKRLTELADYINGFAFKPDDWGQEGLPIIRIEQLKNPEAPADYFEGKLPSSRIIDDGDLIFSWSASLFLRIWQHGRAALNQHLFKVIEFDGVDRVFLKGFIDFYLPALTAASHGSTMQHITRKELGRFIALFPDSEDEQAKIAEILSTVDRAIEQTEALISKQGRIKTGLMQDLLTRGIDEHGNLRSESTHQFKDSPLGRIPQDWSATSFGKIFADNGGHIQTGPFGSQLHSHEYVTEGIPVVMPQDIVSGRINTSDIAQIPELKAKAMERHRMLLGDLVFARRGDLSKCAVIHQAQQGWLCGTGCLLMRLPLKALSPRWTADIYRFHTTQRQVSIHAVGSTMPNLNTEILNSLIVARPPLKEQLRIEDRLSSTDEHERSSKSRLEKLKLLKMGLMQDLLTGKKRVTALLQETVAQ